MQIYNVQDALIFQSNVFSIDTMVLCIRALHLTHGW